MAKKSMFDKIAKPKTKESVSVSKKKVASSTPAVKSAVDQVIRCKATIAKALADKDIHEQTIIEHVRADQDAEAFEGNYSKTYLVEGHEGTVTYTTADSFSVPQDQASLDALKDLLGDKFDAWFKTKRVISLQDGIEKKEELIAQFFHAIEEAGMDPSEVFNAVDTVIATEDLDRKQYDLDPRELEVFRSLVRQRKAALK